MESSPSRPDWLIRVAFDLAPSGMLAVGANGRVLLANQEADRIFGYSAGDLTGRAIEELIPAGHRPAHSGYFAEFFRNPTRRAMGAGRDLRGRRRDGSEFPVEIGLNPVRSEGTTVVLVSVVDITERHEAERVERERDDRLRQAQKLEALGTLAGGIAHDFNNVLAGIVGYTELALRQVEGRVDVAEDLEQVLRAADRGSRLVRRILLFSRERDAVRERIEPERVVREAAELLRASLPATIQLRIHVDAAVPRVLADETLLHQVVLNLCTNAAHAMERGGVLQLELTEQRPDAALRAAHPVLTAGRYVRLRVTDEGVGMTPEVRARIFEPFFTTRQTGQGSGLGLFVVIGIVKSLGGAIDIESAVGKGTRVDVWLPALGEHTGLGAAEASQESAAGTQSPLHCLFVEDEPALGAMERRQLESLGFRVTLHASSTDALEDFRSRPDTFDFLVTDNSMPVMTGLELAREISRLRPELPVLMVSGYADHAEPEVLSAHGVRMVLPKPHTARELGEAIRRLLDER